MFHNTPFLSRRADGTGHVGRRGPVLVCTLQDYTYTPCPCKMRLRAIANTCRSHLCHLTRPPQRAGNMAKGRVDGPPVYVVIYAGKYSSKTASMTPAKGTWPLLWVLWRSGWFLAAWLIFADVQRPVLRSKWRHPSQKQRRCLEQRRTIWSLMPFRSAPCHDLSIFSESFGLRGSMKYCWILLIRVNHARY